MQRLAVLKEFLLLPTLLSLGGRRDGGDCAHKGGSASATKSFDHDFRSAQFFSIPASFIALCGSGLAMNHFQTLPVRRFSAERSVIPTSRPSVSVDIQPVCGLNASAKPYLPQILSPYLSFIACIAGMQMSGVSISDPPAAHGTTVPSGFECAGGPPQAL